MKCGNRSFKPGYIYVLEHPSDSELYKIGITTRKPEKRLAEHNRDFTKAAGRIVEKTGKKWTLKEYHAVPDPYLSEAAFWGATPFSVIPFRGGIEVERMPYETVKAGLKAAMSIGVRPKSRQKPDYVHAYNAWMNKRLKGRGIVLVGDVRSKFGKSNFRCKQGHRWRTVPKQVAEGKGCPQCGQGERIPEEIMEHLDTGYIFLLLRPDKPGFIDFETVRGELEDIEWDDAYFDENVIHRYRAVEDTSLAETIFLNLLGNPTRSDNGLIELDLDKAEQAFRQLHYEIVSHIAMEEKRLLANAESDKFSSSTDVSTLTAPSQ